MLDAMAMTEKAICHACVGDKLVSAEIRATGTQGRCTYCDHRRKRWPLSRLADRVHGVLQANYRLVSPSPWDDHGYDSSGENPAEVITEIAELDDTDIGRDIQDILSDRHGPWAHREGQNDPYGDDIGYAFDAADVSELHASWTVFCRILKTESRVFSSVARLMLDEIFAAVGTLTAGTGQPVIRRFGASRPTRFFRGRVATSDKMLERMLADPARELAPPSHELARVGRMNAAGIALFYGALDVETCLAELRPPVGSHAVITAFENVRPLRLLDLDRLSSISLGGSMFADDFRERYELSRFLSRLVMELSKPIMPGSEELDYLPTQAVADYLADREDLELDGILFPSSQRRGTHLNVALFHRASRAAGKLLPEGCEVTMKGPRKDEGGYPETVTLWIETPSRKRRRKRSKAAADPFGGALFEPEDWAGILETGVDLRQDTLRWIPETLEVHAINEVSYAKDRHGISRHIAPKRKRPMF